MRHGHPHFSMPWPLSSVSWKQIGSIWAMRLQSIRCWEIGCCSMWPHGHGCDDFRKLFASIGHNDDAEMTRQMVSRGGWWGWWGWRCSEWSSRIWLNLNYKLNESPKIQWFSPLLEFHFAKSFIYQVYVGHASSVYLFILSSGNSADKRQWKTKLLGDLIPIWPFPKNWMAPMGAASISNLNETNHQSTNICHCPLPDFDGIVMHAMRSQQLRRIWLMIDNEKSILLPLFGQRQQQQCRCAWPMWHILCIECGRAFDLGSHCCVNYCAGIER